MSEIQSKYLWRSQIMIKKRRATVTSNGKVNKSEHTHFQLPPTKNFLTIVESIVFSDENETGNREKRERDAYYGRVCLTQPVPCLYL